MSFKVRRNRCATCIYTKANPTRRSVDQLEAEVRDERGFLQGHRVCHHTKDACCAGFWARHKHHFPAGQIAQRLNVVEYVDTDIFTQEVAK